MRAVPTLVLLLWPAAALAGCIATTDAPIPATDVGSASGIILHNGRVWTADAAMPWATAVAIRDGRIVAVGDDEAVLDADVGPAPLVVDLGGQMVLPGFHDTHNHVIEVARGLDPTNMEANPYEPWPPGHDPVLATLRQQAIAATHVQVWAQHNAERVQRGELPAPPSRLHGPALELADPDGHVHAPGHLAANDLWFGGPDRANDEAEFLDVLRLGLEAAAEFGITSSVEAGTSLDTLDVLERLDGQGLLTTRFNLYVFPEDLDAVVERGLSTGAGDDDVRLLGLKIYSDGWLGPRTAAMREPYNDRPHRGFIFYTQAEADDFVLRAHQAGLKLTAHTIGDRATEMLLTSYERALDAGCPAGATHAVCTDPRFSLEHVQLVGPDLMDRMVGVGLVPSIQLSFATSDAWFAESALGPQRLQDAYPWKTMVERGLVVGGSSDFPIEVLPPLWGIQRQVTRIDLDGEPAGGFLPEQATDLDTVLRMLTIDAAYLEFREHELGSLTPGKLADIVVLDQDLFDIPPDRIAGTNVVLTMVGGKAVYAAGSLASEFGPG